MTLDLPEGQREFYPAMAVNGSGYCLRQSNERSERAATICDRYRRIKAHINPLVQIISSTS